MVKMGEVIRKNRKFFNKQKPTISDQKSIDLSGQNTHLSEIVDLMMWFVQNGIKKNAKNKK